MAGDAVPVMLVTPVGAPGGAERVLAGLARHLPDHGFEPHVVLLRGGPAVKWFRDAGIDPLVIRSGHGRAEELLRAPFVVLRLRQELRRRGIDVIVSSLAKAQPYGGAAARLAGIPDVYWQHGIPRGRLLDRGAQAVPARAVVCSSDVAVDEQRRQTPSALVRKVHPGIDLDAVRAQKGRGPALRRELGWDGLPTIGIVGRLEPWKGQRTFLRAAAAVAVGRPQLRVAVVGGAVVGHEGTYPTELEQLARDLGIAERTFFAGHDEDVYRWYEALDVVVHASEEPEPFGLVLVEAMALGAAVVATAGGGPLEIIEDGVSGLFVGIGDVDAMASAIGALLDDPDRRARVGSAAQARAERFSEQRMTAAFAAVLREVLAERQAGRPSASR